MLDSANHKRGSAEVRGQNFTRAESWICRAACALTGCMNSGDVTVPTYVA
jgi:hypothetical protein